MALRRSVAGILAGMVGVAATQSLVSGAYITEVFLPDEHAPGRPAAVEIAAFTSHDTLELALLSAHPTQRGLVLQTFTFEPDLPVTLLTEHAWPAAEPWAQPGAAAHRPLGEITDDPELELAGPRTLLLFDQPTGLLRHQNIHDPHVQQAIAHVHQLDAVTFGPAGLTAAHDHGPLTYLDDDDTALARPYDMLHYPADELLAGRPDEMGRIEPTDREPYRLTPGWHNPALPAPATLTLLAAALPLLIRRSRFNPRS